MQLQLPPPLIPFSIGFLLALVASLAWGQSLERIIDTSNRDVMLKLYNESFEPNDHLSPIDNTEAMDKTCRENYDPASIALGLSMARMSVVCLPQPMTKEVAESICRGLQMSLKAQVGDVITCYRKPNV